jgi:hypothetical protein
MKKLLLMMMALLSFGMIKAQIMDVQQKGMFIYVYGEGNKVISQHQVQSTDILLGMGSSFFIVKKGMFFRTYDHNSKEIGYLQVATTDKFKNASGNTFNVTKGQFVYTYDKNCKLISSRQE